jgi:hypothetical protein
MRLASYQTECAAAPHDMSFALSMAAMCQQYPAELMKVEDAPLIRKKKKEEGEPAATELE